MPTTVTKYEHVAVLTSKDDLNRETVDQFKHCAEKCVGEGVSSLVVDCSHMTAIDSAGLEALLDLQDKCEDALGSVKLCSLDDTLSKVLEITRLVRRFEIFPDLDSAVKSFS